MKAKQFLIAIIASCGIIGFSTIQANAQKASASESESQAAMPQRIGEGQINVAIYGLQSGSADIKITTSTGKVYRYSGSSAGSIGNFIFEGDYFDVEVTPYSTTPAFWKIAGSANLGFATPESLNCRVTWSEGDPMRYGGVTVVFGRP